jgi:hypothetical protein
VSILAPLRTSLAIGPGSCRCVDAAHRHAKQRITNIARYVLFGALSALVAAVANRLLEL